MSNSNIERTLSIIKPDSVSRNIIGAMIGRMEACGLRVAAARLQLLTHGQAEGFYAEHRERPFFNDLIEFMTSGPVMILVLEGKNAITRYRALMGSTNPAMATPGTIRFDFCRNTISPSANGLHGSDSPESAEREITFFFRPEEIVTRVD